MLQRHLPQALTFLHWVDARAKRTVQMRQARLQDTWTYYALPPKSQNRFAYAGYQGLLDAHIGPSHRDVATFREDVAAWATAFAWCKQQLNGEHYYPHMDRVYHERVDHPSASL